VDADGYNSTSQSVTVQNDSVTTNDVTLQYNSTTDGGTSNDGSTDGDEDGTTDDGSTDGDEDGTTDDGSTDGDEDGTTDDGAICVEIVVDEYRIVENQEVNLTTKLGSATADEVSFEWFVSGESFGGDTQSIEYVFDDAGDYKVSVRVTEDATGDILECTLSLNEQDWTNVVETADGEIIFTDLIVKTYDADGNPVNATVEFSPDYRDKDVTVGYSAPNNQINHTTEWQVIADAGYLIGATYSVNDSTVISAVRSNVNVAAGEMKTVELTLTNDSSFEHQMPGFLGECHIICKFFEDIEEEPPGGDGVGIVLSGDGVGDGVGDGGGDGGISSAITLSILAAATLLIIIGVFWLFKLLAAVLGIDGGTNGLGRILRGEDD
jgi:hypothetical protein